MDSRLEQAAVRRGGYFTRAEAQDCGYDDRTIRAAVRAGEWRRLRRGYYAPASLYDDLDDRARHLIVCRVVQERLGDRAVISHQSASCAWGHDQWGWDMSIVHITRLDSGAARTEAGVRHHRTAIDQSDLVRVEGLWVPNETRTVFEACTDLSVESGLSVASSALRGGGVTKQGLEEYGQSDRARAWPQSRSARLAIRLSDGRLQSVGESVSYYMFWRFAIPIPELQYEVRTVDGRLIGYTDFAWPAYCHFGEFDGKRKYTRDVQPDEDPGEVVFREKRREDELRREGAGMSRLIWRDLNPPHRPASARRVRSEMETSARLYGRGRTIIA
jgi:Transcriptional regulator, AbiEi antitoxin